MALALLAAPLQSQQGWRAVSRSQADLWFHGLALVGFQGFGAGELYDAGYASRVRAAKASLGGESELDREAQRLLTAFQADSAFEVFHFVPLYFGAAGRLEMLDALKGLAEDPPSAVAQASPAARFGTAAVAAVLSEPHHLSTLGDFVAALESEWTSFFRDFRADSLVPALESAIGDSQLLLDNWNGSLEEYLGPNKLSRGMLVISPPVGSDGRLFQGDPARESDNVAVVGGVGQAAAYRVVREWCFPAARQAVQAAGPSERHEAELASGRTAIRCGAILLGESAPDHVGPYLKAFGVSSSEELAEAFPVSRGVLRELARILAEPKR